jgi:3-phytase
MQAVPAQHVEIAPVAETEAVASDDPDPVDDPAIWAAAPGGSVRFGRQAIHGFVAATDKTSGLRIYSLTGKHLQLIPGGELNNVDLKEASVAGRNHVVLAASDRERGGISFYAFDPAGIGASNNVRPFGFVRSDVREAYGLCMGKWDGGLHAVLIGKRGAVRIYRIETGVTGVTGTETARFEVGARSEGCTVDETAGALYVAEEDKGLWRYSLRDFSRTLVELAGQGRLTAGVEGVALIQDGARRYLLVSSQGDSTFAVWRVDWPAPAFAGRFSVAGSKGIDEVTGSDGVDARGGAVGSSFPEGLVVVQDDEDEGGTQNFKLLDWRAIKRGMRLD